MIVPISLGDRLRAARSELTDALPDEAALVAPVLAQIELALARIPGDHAAARPRTGVEGAADTPRLQQVEEALRVTEQQLAATLRCVGEAVIATDAAGRVTFVNDVAEALTGWSAAEARAEPLDRVFPIIDAATREAVESPVAMATRERGVVGLANPTLLVRRDGVELSIDDSVAAVRDANGQLVGVVLIFRDVSEKRREEERRAFLADVSRQLLETSLDYEKRLSRVAELAVPRLADWAAIDMLTSDGSIRRLAVAHIDPRKIAHVNAIAKRYPTPLDALHGVPHILRSGESEMIADLTDEMLVAASRGEEHLRLIREIGLRSYISVPLTIAGRTFGAITFAMAETNRRFGPDDLAYAQEIAHRAAAPIDNARLYAHAQEARARAEAAEDRFRSLAEAIPQIVWSTDGAGKHEYLSPKWSEYTGQSSEEPMADRWVKAIHPDDLDTCFRQWAAAAEARVPWQVEYRIRRADGAYRWYLGRSIPVFEGSQVVKWYGTATDIDEQRRAIRTRDDVLATVSHDLRNPLGNILLSAELLQETVDDAAGYVDGIKRAANRMSALIRDLLDITALEGGQLSIHRCPVPTGELVAEAIAQQQALARQKGVTLRLIPAPAEVTVVCDRDRLLQVFANLLGNALKFTPAAGTITVAHAVVGACVEIEVADSGPGIPADQQLHVFDRFWRDKESTHSGSGLGLAICKGIIEQHGGQIRVTSREGQGATFVFTLPL